MIKHLPEWIMKRYAKLWSEFKDKEFTKKQALKAHVNNPDESVSWSGAIPILSNDGDDCRIGFDIGFLEKLVGSMDADTLTWCHNGPEKASIFSGDKKTNEINLLMPIKLKDEENQS